MYIKSAASFAISCFVAGLLMTSGAQALAPACPDPSITDPLQALEGSWAFSTSGFRASDRSPLASSGLFVATIGTGSGGKTTGVLTITVTSNRNGQISRQETGAGGYTVASDCSGGSLIFNLASGQVVYDFWFNADGTKIHLVGGGEQTLTFLSFYPGYPYGFDYGDIISGDGELGGGGGGGAATCTQDFTCPAGNKITCTGNKKCESIKDPLNPSRVIGVRCDGVDSNC
jgi:hypothetical protein